MSADETDVNDETRLKFTVGALKMICTDLGDSTGRFVREAIATATEPLQQQIRALEQRVEELSQRDYKGIWVGKRKAPR